MLHQLEINLISRSPEAPQMKFGTHSSFGKMKRAFPDPKPIEDAYRQGDAVFDPPKSLPEWCISAVEISEFVGSCANSLLFQQRRFAHHEVPPEMRGWDGLLVIADVMRYQPESYTVDLYREYTHDGLSKDGLSCETFLGPYYNRILWVPTKKQFESRKDADLYLDKAAETLFEHSRSGYLRMPVLPPFIRDHPRYIEACNQQILKAQQWQRRSIIRACQVDVEKLPEETQALAVAAVLIGRPPRGPKLDKNRFRPR